MTAAVPCAWRPALAALGLPDAWRDRDAWTLLDTAFGTGGAFLAALQAWRADPGRCRRMRWAALLAAPIGREALAARLRERAVDHHAAAELVAQWPPALRGVHRMSFDGGRVQLSLAVGPAREMLPGWLPHADALLVHAGGGTAPEGGVAFHSGPPAQAGSVADAGSGAPTVATVDAATLRAAAALLVTDGVVAILPARDGEPAMAACLRALATAGFHAVPVPGTGGALRARRVHGRSVQPTQRAAADRVALVIGGGLAGCAAGDALASRGWSVLRLEGPTPDADAGSWQPVLAQHPSVTPDDSPASRITRAAALLSAGPRGGGALRMHGRLQCMSAERAVAAAGDLPAEWVRAIDAGEASRLTGIRLREGGLWLPMAGSVDPIEQCDAWTTDRVRVRRDTLVASVVRTTGGWRAVDVHGRTLGEGRIALLATGASDLRIVMDDGAPFSLHAQLGPAGLQSLAARTSIARPGTDRMPRCTIGGDGHAVPIDAERLLLGPAGWLDEGVAADPRMGVGSPAPAEVGDSSSAQANASAAACAAWTRHAHRLVCTGPLPALAPGPSGVRLSARDHLPLAGAVPDAAAIARGAAALRRDDRLALPVMPGLWMVGALGGRGLLWSVIAAEWIASRLEGDPAPLEATLGATLAPDRFLRRALRRADTAP